MSDHNRGAYTPQSEAPLAFDARRTRGGGGGDRPFPLALVVSAVILIAIVVALVIFLMKQPDGSEAAPGETTVIDAMKAPPPVEAVPVAAPPPGMQVVTEDPNLVTPAFTPPPEQPAPRPTAPVAAAPVAPVAKAPAAKAPAAVLDPVGQLTIAPIAPAAPKAPVAASNAPKGIPAPVAPSAQAQVQIGAFSSAALAEKGWNDIAGMFPGQMAGKTKRVEKVETGDATLHRASIGGFASRADADAFCQALKGRGKTCFVR